MGKIKSKAIRKSAKILEKEGVELSDNFERNKKLLNPMLLSKKLRNQLAGLIANAKKRRRANSQ